MSKNFFRSIIVLFFLISFQAHAGKDPVSWSLNPATGFPANTTMGSSYAVSYTLTNNLPFAVPLTISAAYTGGAFTVTNGCDRTLSPGEQCLVHVSFQPIKSGASNIRLTMAYHKNRVPLPLLSSTATSNETGDKISGHVTTPLPPVTYVGVSYPVQFSYVNNGTSSVTATSVNASGFTPNTNTCTSALVPNSSCNVAGTFTPTTTGSSTLSVTYNYSGGSVPLSTQTNTHSSGDCHHIEGQAVLPLPVNSFQFADNVIKVTFTNHCDSGSEALGAVNALTDGIATLTKGTDGCSNTTLAANSSCSVFYSVVPNAVNSDLSVTVSIPYNGSTLTAYVTTSMNVGAIPSFSGVNKNKEKGFGAATHTVYFVNQCDENVWYEFANGAGGVNSPDPTPATQRTYLDYQLPKQLTGAAPSTKVLSFGEYINGGIYGRTHCQYSNNYCLTANCPIQGLVSGKDDWSCQAGIGATGPITQLEEYMPSTVNNDGVYDISIINGMNVPAEMKSLAALDASNPFGCGQAAGAVIQPQGSRLGAASWTFTPPTTAPDAAANYVFSSPGADDGCTTTCGVTNEYCGMAYNSFTAVNGGVPPINRRCGTFLGYWQIGDYVTFDDNADWGTVNLYSLYSLGTALGNGPTGIPYGTIGGVQTTIADLYTCPAATSTNSLGTGYNAGNVNACGCNDWSFTASASPCLSFNSDWTATPLPRFAWLKQACPTCYTFQFDDPSSSFQCDIPAQKTSYQITFCPAGQRGKPQS